MVDLVVDFEFYEEDHFIVIETPGHVEIIIISVPVILSSMFIIFISI